MKSLLKGICIGLGIGIILLAGLYLYLTLSGNHPYSPENTAESSENLSEPADETVSSQEPAREETISEPPAAATAEAPAEELPE